MTDAIRLAVFDVDGTLIDSQHHIVAAMTEAWEAHGLGQPKPEAVRRIIGLSLVEAVAALMPEADHALHVRVAHSYKEAFLSARERPGHQAEPLFEGALESLDALEKAGWLLAIATGKSKRGLDSMLERTGLKHRFVSAQCADGHPGKPHPAMLLQAMREAGADAANTVMIGDTSYDMLMARAAKARALGVAWGYHAIDELLSAGAHAVVESYSRVYGQAERLVGQSAALAVA